MRRAAKREIAEPQIVTDLEAAGFHVYRSLPVDLLIHRASWGAGWFRCLEVKTPHLNEHRKDRRSQRYFLLETGTPIAKTSLEALKAMEATK